MSKVKFRVEGGVKSEGNLLPDDNNNQYYIGSSDLKWKGIYVGTDGVVFNDGSVQTQASQPTVSKNSQTSAYTIVSSDNGKYIDITSGGVTFATTTAFTVGQNVVIYNNSSSNQTITEGSGVTLRWAGTSSTGNRTLAQYGIATAICVGTDTYVIAGTGLS